MGYVSIIVLSMHWKQYKLTKEETKRRTGRKEGEEQEEQEEEGNCQSLEMYVKQEKIVQPILVNKEYVWPEGWRIE